jgi:hypothetical protein
VAVALAALAAREGDVAIPAAVVTNVALAAAVEGVDQSKVATMDGVLVGRSVEGLISYIAREQMVRSGLLNIKKGLTRMAFLSSATLCLH